MAFNGITVKGPATYKLITETFDARGELVRGITVKDIGIYKMKHNGKVVLTAEVFLIDGKAYGRYIHTFTN